jgi:hypothetical protein
MMAMINSRAVLVFLQLQADNSGSNTVARNKARGLLTLLRNKSVIYFVHFFLDVTTCLPTLSQFLQKQEALIGETLMKAEMVIETLERYKYR